MGHLPGSDLDTDAHGFTVFPPAPLEGKSAVSGSSGRRVYCSAQSGSDSNNGTEGAPVQTLDALKNALRNGFGDQGFLKRGDTWTNQSFLNINKSGVSPNEPMLIGAYGSGPRPLVKVNSGTHGKAVGSTGASGMNNFALVGIDFYAYTRNPDDPDYNAEHAVLTFTTNGTAFLYPASFLLQEDCVFRYFHHNAVIPDTAGGAETFFGFRRCIINNSFYPTGNHRAQGIVPGTHKGAVVEECTLDHNGWHPDLGERTAESHNIYGYSRNMKIRNNILARGSSHGCTLNYGDVAIGNLCIGNAIGIHIKPPYEGGQAVCQNNVILHGGGHGLAWGITTGLFPGHTYGTTPSILIDGNIIAHADLSSGLRTITGTSGLALTVSNNIVFGWNAEFNQMNSTDHTQIDNLIDLLGANIFGFPDPGRTIARYDDEELGSSGTMASFLQKCRDRGPGEWPEELSAAAANEWFRAGFEGAEPPPPVANPKKIKFSQPNGRALGRR